MAKAKASPGIAPRGSRPVEITDELADLICEKIADGQSLRKICDNDAMPTKATVCRWLGRHPGFADQYARAREAQADTHADDMIDIADDPKLDPHEKRVRIDTRKWLAGKQRPKKYGDATQVRHSGAVGTFDPSKLSNDELTSLIGILGGASSGVGDGEDGEGGASEA